MLTKLIIFFLAAAILFVVEQGVKVGMALRNPNFQHVLTPVRKICLLMALSYIITVIATGL